jgi:dolichol kinase
MLLLIFIPGLAVKEFLSFAFLSALYFLTILEKLRPSIQILNNFFLKFIDERDSSDLIVTHLYLLLGFGFPVIFSVLFNNDLISWSGIISLGIGDTFACLSGVTLGRHRLPYRRKTLEGTLGGYISMILSLSFFYPISPSLGTCLFLVSFYEAFTLKIDNLVLPIFSIALFSCL